MVTLKEFIVENFNLITVIGVFGALVAYFSGLKNPMSSFLTFSSLLIFILLCAELWVSFPKSEDASTRLSFFEVFFVWLAGSVLLYIFYFVYVENVEDKTMSLYFNIIIYFVFCILAVILFEKSELYKKIRVIAPETSKLSPITRGLCFIDVICFALFLAYLLINFIQKIASGYIN